MAIRVATFNVNGLRSFSKYVATNYRLSFNDFLLTRIGADVLCVQETKGTEATLAEFGQLRDYAMFCAHCTHRKSYCGVATFVRRWLRCDSCDEVLERGHGRALETRHGSFSVLNLYFPYVGECSRGGDDYEAKKTRAMEFYRSVGDYVHGKERLVICGDFNTVYEIRDHYQFENERTKIAGYRFHGKPPRRNERPFPCPTTLPFEFFDVEDLESFLFEAPQRRWLRDFLARGTHVDGFRVCNGGSRLYTCWNTMLGLRPRNLGTRIDLVLVPGDVKVVGSQIMSEVMGSDHCPMYVDVELGVEERRDVVSRRDGIFAFLREGAECDSKRGLRNP
eukprot:jgi/Antlo1/310/672